MCRFGLLSIIVITLSALPWPTPAAAAVAPPDAAAITGVWAFQNILESGDQCYLITYDVTYSTAPADYTATQLIIIRLLDSSFAEYSATVPYAFYNDGFAYGLVGFYFTADQAASLAMPFGDTSGTVVQLNYNPTVSWSSTPTPFTLTTFTSWCDKSAQSMMTLRLRQIMQKIEDEWSGTVDLITGDAWNRTLTIYGSDYVTNSVPNIINLCPTIFSSHQQAPDWPSDDVYISDCYIVGDPDVTVPIYAGTRAMQEWRATQNYGLDSFQLPIRVTGTPPAALVLTLSSSGTTVASGTIAPSDITTAWSEIVMGQQYQIMRGGLYKITLSTSGGSPSNCYHWLGSTDARYQYGGAYTSDDGGISWTPQSYDLLFIASSAEGMEGAYSNKWAHRLDGTPFDMSGLADRIGVSPMWLRGILWMIFTLAVAIVATRFTANIRTLLLVAILMIAIGAASGFLYITFAAFMTFLLFVVIVYSLFWEKSTS